MGGDKINGQTNGRVNKYKYHYVKYLILMHIYQGERDLCEKNQALAIPGGFQVDKETAISSEQLSQV